MGWERACCFICVFEPDGHHGDRLRFLLVRAVFLPVSGVVAAVSCGRGCCGWSTCAVGCCVWAIVIMVIVTCVEVSVYLFFYLLINKAIAFKYEK